MKKVILSALVISSLAFATKIELHEGWQLLGTDSSFVDINIFKKDSIQTVWTYDKVTKKWRAYSPDNYLQAIINDNNQSITPLTSIGSNEGFWVNAYSSDTLTWSDSSSTAQPTPTLTFHTALPVRVGQTNSSVVSAADANGTMAAVTVASSDTNIATVSYDNNNGSVVVTGVSAGSATIAITATDNNGASSHVNLIAVVSANVVPTVTLDAISLNLLKDASATSTITATDLDGMIVSVVATSSDTAVATVTNTKNSVSVTGVAAGDATVTVIVTDNDGAVTSKELNVNVTELFAPTVTLNPTSLTILRGDTNSSVVTATDSDGNITSINVVSDNTNVATATYLNSSVVVTAIAKGTANVTVTATDNSGQDGNAVLSVTVPNTAPVISAVANQSVDYNTSMTAVQVIATDADVGDTLIYSASGLPTGITLSTSGLLSGISTASGVYPTTVTVTDGEANAMTNFNLTVGDAPIAGLNEIVASHNLSIDYNDHKVTAALVGTLSANTIKIETSATVPTGIMLDPSNTKTLYLVESTGNANYIEFKYKTDSYAAGDIIKVTLGSKTAEIIVGQTYTNDEIVFN